MSPIMANFLSVCNHGVRIILFLADVTEAGEGTAEGPAGLGPVGSRGPAGPSEGDLGRGGPTGPGGSGGRSPGDRWRGSGRGSGEDGSGAAAGWPIPTGWVAPGHPGGGDRSGGPAVPSPE